MASSADGARLLAGVGSTSFSTQGPLYTSTNSGVTWFTNAVPQTNWASVAMSADGNTLLAVAGASVYISTNGGANWILRSVAPSINLSSAAMSADGAKLFVAAHPGGIYMLQKTPAPQLAINGSGSNLAFSWTVPSTNFVLQESPDLAGSNWVTLTNSPVLNFTNLKDELSIPLPDGAGYFRLITQ
jgi:photosystem II stability/assembly factor-like uncharacterized protein